MKKQFKTVIILIVNSIVLTACQNDDNPTQTCTGESMQSYLTEVNDTTTSVYTDIIINANPSEVWSVLTDFENMPNWSTTLQGISGNISNGGSVIATYLFDTLTFNAPHTLIYIEGQEFGWSDESNTYPGITDHHLFQVKACGNQTRFIQSDQFIGSNPNISTLNLAQLIQGQYNIFNTDLKNEVEK